MRDSQVVDREPVAAQVQIAVQQDRRVPGRQHEVVAVGPVGMSRVVAHEAPEQDVGEGGKGHRGTGVTGVRLAGRVHGETPHDVDGLLLEGRGQSHGSSVEVRSPLAPRVRPRPLGKGLTAIP